MLGAQSPTRDLGRPDAALEKLIFGSPPSHPSPITLLPAPPPVWQSIPVLGCGLTVGCGRRTALGHRGQKAREARTRGEPALTRASTEEETGEGTGDSGSPGN